MTRRRSQRGGAMLEGALVFMVFAVMAAGIMEIGIIGFAANSVTFAAHRAARYASLRGGASGHAATVADIQAAATATAAPLSASNLTVTVTWLPNNQPGNSVQVTVAYAIGPSIRPIYATALTLRSTARARIVQ